MGRRDRPPVGVVALAIVGLQALRASLTRNHTLAVAGLTLLAAAHAQPMRGRVPVTVHRLFNRSRIDAGLALAGSGGQARDQVDLGRILGSVAATAVCGARPSHGDGVAAERTHDGDSHRPAATARLGSERLGAAARGRRRPGRVAGRVRRSVGGAVRRDRRPAGDPAAANVDRLAAHRLRMGVRARDGVDRRHGGPVREREPPPAIVGGADRRDLGHRFGAVPADGRACDRPPAVGIA